MILKFIRVLGVWAPQHLLVCLLSLSSFLIDHASPPAVVSGGQGGTMGVGGSGGIGRWVSKLYCSHGVPERPRNDRLLHFPLAEFLEWCRVGEGHCLSNQLPFLSGFVRASRLPGGTADPPP